MLSQKKSAFTLLACVLLSTLFVFQNCGKKTSSVATDEDLELKIFTDANQQEVDGELSTSGIKNGKNSSVCPAGYDPVYTNGKKKIDHCVKNRLNFGYRSYDVCKYLPAGSEEYATFEHYRVSGTGCMEVSTVNCAPKYAVCESYSCQCTEIINCASGKYDPNTKACL